jgi:hypothetical protein
VIAVHFMITKAVAPVPLRDKHPSVRGSTGEAPAESKRLVASVNFESRARALKLVVGAIISPPPRSVVLKSRDKSSFGPQV